MNKRYLAAGAVVLGLLVTPAIASAVSTQQSAPIQQDSVPTATQPGYEWMNQMHDSVWNGDANSGYGSMMGGSVTGTLDTQNFLGMHGGR